MADMKLQAVFTLIDRVTAPLKKITKVTDGVSKSLEGVSKAAATVRSRIGAAKGALDALGKSSQNTAKSLARVTGFLTAATAAAWSAGSAFLGIGVWQVSKQFEAYEAVLKTNLGTQDKARKAMMWVEEFAKKTPYDLAGVMESYVKLTAYGIEPQTRALRVLGDTAAGMGKPLMQAVEALADAQTGEFERLKEFGIKSRQEANKVTFTYNHAGKEIAISAAKNGSAIQDALLGIFETRFSGAMEELSKTGSGIEGNLSDWLQGIQKLIGSMGIYDHIKARLGSLMGALDDLSENGQMAEWAQRMSDGLIKMFDAIDNLVSSIDWPGLINWIADAAENVGKLIDFLGGFKGIIDLGIAVFIASLIASLSGLVVPLIAVAGALTGVSVAAWPITGIILIIAGLAAIAFLVWRNWDFLWGKFKTFIGWMKEKFQFFPVIGPFIQLADLVVNHWDKVWQFFKDLGAFLHKWFIEEPKKWWNAMPDWLQKLLTGAAAFSINPVLGAGVAANLLRPEAARPQAALPAYGQSTGVQSPVGGDIGVHLSYDKPPRITSVQPFSNTRLTAIMGHQVGGRS